MKHLSRTFERVLLYQKYSGNILDLGPRKVKTFEGPSREEDRTQVATGGTRATARRHEIEIPVAEEEAARLARLMFDGVGCPVGAYLIGQQGTEHWSWLEPVRGGFTESAGRQVGTVGQRAIRLQSRLYDPAIGRGRDLLEPVPWNSTSTAAPLSNAYGIASLPDGRLAASDRGAGEIVFYQRLNGRITGRVPIPLGDNRDLTWDTGRREFLVVDASSDEIARVTEDGTFQGTFTIEDPSNNAVSDLRGVTTTPDGFAVQTDEDTLYFFTGIPKSGTATADSEGSVANIFDPTPGRLAFDSATGDLLAVGIGNSSTGEKVVRRFNGVSASLDSQFFVTNLDGIAVRQGNLLTKLDDETLQVHDGLTSTVNRTVDLSGPQPYVPGGVASDRRPGYDGPYWKNGIADSTNILGTPANADSNDPAVIEIIAPLWGAVVIGDAELGGTLSGTIKALNWSGSQLDSGPIDSAFTIPKQTWTLRLEAVPEYRPVLNVQDAGTPFGALDGGAPSDCSRVGAPAWASGVDQVIP